LGCKLLSIGTIMTVPIEEAPANFVPAAAVIRGGQALFGEEKKHERYRKNKTKMKKKKYTNKKTHRPETIAKV